MLKADEQGEYAHLLEQFVASQQQHDDKIHGVQYLVEQGDSFSFPRIFMEVAQNQNDNFAAKRKVASALYVDQFQLLGSIRIHPSSQEIQLNPGLVHQLNGEC